MDAAFCGADGRVFLDVTAEDHVNSSLRVGTFAPSLVSFGGFAFLVPRPPFHFASCVIFLPVDEPRQLPLVGQLMQDTFEFATLGQGVAMFFVVVAPQIVVATIGRGGSRRWSWQLVPNGEEYVFSVAVEHQVVTSI